MKSLRVTGLLALVSCILLMEMGCGDYYRPVANPIPSPGGQPQVAHFAWVVNFNPNGDGSTTEINVSGDTNAAVNSMGVGSIAEAFPASSLALFVANSGDDTVSEYLPTLAGAVTTISLLAGSHPIYLSSAINGSMYVLNSGNNSICPSTGSISTIQTSTLAVSNTTCVGNNPIAMAQTPNNNYVYVLNQGDNTVSVFSANSNTVVGTITTANGLGLNPASVTVSVDSNWIFVVTSGDGTNPGALDIISAGATTVAASVPLGVGATYSVIDPNLNRLYVANSGSNTVSVFDSSSINPPGNPPIPLLATVPVGTTPIGVTPLADGSNFYVANSGSNDVTVVSASSFSVLGSVPLPAGANPVFIASDPTASKVYIADQGTSETTIIQTSNNTVSQNISAPTQVSGCTSACALQTPVMILTR